MGDESATENGGPPLSKNALKKLLKKEAAEKKKAARAIARAAGASADHCKTNTNGSITERAENIVVSSDCKREGNSGDAARVAEGSETTSFRSAERSVRPGNDGHTAEDKSADSKSSINISLQARTAYFDNLRTFCKVGKGRECWWEIGRYSMSCASDENAGSDAKSRGRVRSIIIGVQPHRNPLCNGLSIVFHDETSRVKLGRMLLRNTSSRRPGKNEHQPEPLYYSSLVGMEVDKSRRGEGLSKIFVAIWLHICLMTNTYPRAAVMNKPLISCVLMGFNFVPQNGGSRVELIRLTNDNTIGGEGGESNPQIALFSPSAKSLKGLFSQRALRMQNIAILDHPPAPTSGQSATVIYVKTGFEHPIAISENAVDYTPPHDYQLISEERTVCDGKPSSLTQQNKQQHQNETRQSSTQRGILANQINSILKINVEGTTASANLEYFANVTSLKGAMSSCDRLFSPSDIAVEDTAGGNLSRQEEPKQSKDRKRSYSAMATL